MATCRVDESLSEGVRSPGSDWKCSTRRKDGKWLGSTILAQLNNSTYAAIVKTRLAIEVEKGDNATAARIRQGLAKAKIPFLEVSQVHPQTLRAFVKES